MLESSIKIGKLTLPNRVFAAPMAGYTDYPWRIIARELGAGCLFSEMISAEGLRRASKKTSIYLENDERARPFGIQLFGSKPETFVGAIEIMKKYPFDLLDINMGCPVRKVVKRGEGAALMKTPETAEAILSAIRRCYDGPLTIKIRSGWCDDTINAVEFAKMAESGGADAVIVHPRTRMQVFHGRSNWDIIRRVKEAVKIKVIGNGDIIDKMSADKMVAETGCDAIMIGRAAIGNPWVFGEVVGSPAPTTTERFELIRKHIGLIRNYADEKGTIAQIRKFLPKYLKGFRGCKELFVKLCATNKVDEALDHINQFEQLF